MNRDDRKVDRKADPDAAKPPEEAAVETSGDRRDIHDAGKRLRDAIAARVPSIPDVDVSAAAVGTLYAATVGGGLAVAYGATSLATEYAGTDAGLITGGIFAVVYGYVGISAAANAGVRP